MKVIFNHQLPFMLTHGGVQIQIEQTQRGLIEAGVTVEPLRWWDAAQNGDVLQHFARIPIGLVRLAQRKGMKVVMVELMTEQGSRTKSRLVLQKLVMGLTRVILPQIMVGYFNWDSYRLADACVASTPWEAYLMKYIFGAPADKVHVIPNGVEKVFLESQAAERGRWLVCTAIITERKRVLELAEAALRAQTPIWVVGKPYSEADSYFQRFLGLAKSYPETIRYEGAISDRQQLAQVYRQARGFVLLSKWETLSLAALEAAACECPLLLSDLPWARSHFGPTACYCPVNHSVSRTADYLHKFYEAAPRLKPPPKPASWLEVASQFKGLYEKLLASPKGPAGG